MRTSTIFLASAIFGVLALASPTVLATAGSQDAVQKPRELERHIAQAEALVAQKRLAEAEATLLAVRPPAGASRRLDLLLAQIRLWQGRVHEAAADFRALLSSDPSDAAAREGLATALYWAGDWPAAAREYRQLLVSAPGNEAARTALAEIERTAAAAGEAGVSLARDDQPYRRVRGYVAFTPAAESLTRWRVEAGSYHLESIAHEVSATAPFAAIKVSTSFPRSGFSVEAWARGQKFPDGDTKLLGGGALHRSLSPQSRISLVVDQRELLYTTTSLNTHPYVTAATLRWDLEQPSGWYAAAYAEGLRHSDDNRGLAVGGYAAAPVVRRPSLTVWLGGGASYRDTDETRYRLETFSSRPAPGGGFAYEYKGVYDPYWTPIETTEVRAAMALRWVSGGGTALRFHADGGAGRESAIGFGPASGSSPFPLPGAGVFERNYNPWRAGFELTRPLNDSSSIVLSYEHFVTAFYVSNEAAIRYSRRF